ncbi:MAG: hypothetical protein NTY82_00840 [Actinobacteria bacterium]|nr:hypothetical protein [Actinomycetota bacterium]
MRLVAFIAGSLGTLAVLAAIVDGMLITRASRSRLGRAIGFLVLALAKLPLRFIRSFPLRDRWLSGVAPVSLLLQLTMYAFLLIVTLGVMIWGCTDLGWGESLYQSGSTFTTLGIVEPVNVPSAIVTFIAAFLGLVVIAVFIGYLLGVFGMYNDRENLMARLAAVAGEPAWGPQVLARSAVIGSSASDAIDAQSWLDWTIQVRTNTLINPTFGLFRSTSPNSHWVISQLAILDAMSLRMAIEPATVTPVDIRMLSGGTVTCGLLAGNRIHNWETEERVLDVLSQVSKKSETELSSAGLSEEEWGQGWSELVVSKVVTSRDESRVRERFVLLRQFYFADAYFLAEKHHAICAPWSGPRFVSAPVVFPERASDWKGRNK